ncbi:MAG: hypothetical protein SFU99_15640 [Saprospiraceae bacterium]|nr:hypothetical protein [Saprospiraceae bacterium]
MLYWLTNEAVHPLQSVESLLYSAIFDRMKVAALTLLLVAFIRVLSFSQDLTLGIHAVNPTKGMKCQLKLKLQNTKESYCILQTPIVTASDFTGVGEIYVDTLQKLAVFDLLLNETAAKKVYTLSKGFQDIQLAMVVDQRIVSILSSKGNVVNGVVRFSQEGGTYDDLRRLQQTLMRAINQ